MIARFAQRLRRLLRDARGAVVIETAIAAPVLALLSIGGFQVSQVVARQHELQSGADDAGSMALAGWSSSTGSTTAIKSVLMKTLNLTTDKVTITTKYRCGTATAYVAAKTSCAATDIVTTYLDIVLTDTYTPMWSDFGVGGPIAFRVQRTVLVS